MGASKPHELGMGTDAEKRDLGSDGRDEHTHDVTGEEQETLVGVLGEGRQPPQQPRGFFTRLVFGQVTPILVMGSKRQLQPTDMWEMEPKEKAEEVHRQFVPAWNEEVSRWKAREGDPKRPPRPSIFRTLAKMYWKHQLRSAACAAVYCVSVLSGPNIMRAIIHFMGDATAPAWKGYLLALAFCCVPIIGTTCWGHSLLLGFQLGIRARSIMTVAVYQKALRLSTAVRQDPAMSQGKIVNVMAVDSQAFVEGIVYLNFAWVAPTLITAIMCLLYATIGPPCLAGVGLMLLLLPFTMFMGRRTMNLVFKQKRQADQRVTILSEILQGIRVLKYNAWEDSFVQKVSDTRKGELKMLWHLAILRAVNQFCMYSTPILASLATFGVYALTGGTLTAAVVFPTIALFAALRGPLGFLPQTIANISKMFVSRERVEEFLIADEIHSDTKIQTESRSPESSTLATSEGDVIVVENGNFYWHGENYHRHRSYPFQQAEKISQQAGITEKCEKDEKDANAMDISMQEFSENQVMPPSLRGFQLHDINLHVKKGELIGIVGLVGSGKTSLVGALIRDMDMESGRVEMRGKVSYASQVPWILNGTVRDNIVFGQPFDRRRYDDVIRGCALLPDLAILKGGDMAEIGERGITLSGGQKQRISIARAAYSQSDIVILDDPLSAVDSHVGRHLFTKCIKGLMAKCTILLVTNQLHVLPDCDRVVVMKEGRICELGTYTQLMDSAHGELKGLMATYGHADKDGGEGRGGHRGEEGMVVTASGSKEEGKLVQEEARREGTVTMGVWWNWFRAAGGVPFVFFLAATVVGVQAMQMMCDYWLTIWTSNMSGHGILFAGQSMAFYFGIYSGLGMCVCLFIVCRSTTFALGGVRASRRLHENLLKSIMRARVGFFDETPVGRIINRFGKDTDMVDQMMIQNMETMFVSLCEVLGVMVMISLVFPWFLLGVVPLLCFYFWLQTFFRRTSRELQRLESTSRSPIYVQFSETLNGVSTIRTYNVQQRFMDRNKRLVDGNNQSFMVLQVANRWLQFRLELIGMVVLASVSVFSVTARGRGVDASLCGLIMAYSLTLVQQMNWCARMTAETETRMTCVERMVEYTTEDIAESPTHRPDYPAPPVWPTRGEVQFNGLILRYRLDLPPVLKGVTSTLKPGEKIGIVGRTGSGKSTLMVSLFRLIEPEAGNILIDGVDIHRLGLHDLRSRIAIIPQDPILFSQKKGAAASAFGQVGGIRFNLDPEGKFSDAELWNALEHACMAHVVRALPGGLDAHVAEGGGNFSVGQRQLLCLARALLKKPRVLVLDEATANVDVYTDMLIQRTIREQLQGVTCLTIAHRLHTIMDADKVMVMEQGRLAEFGAPSDLLANEDGLLTSLVNETGPSSAACLRAIARGEVSIFTVLSDLAFDVSKNEQGRKKLEAGRSVCGDATGEVGVEEGSVVVMVEKEEEGETPEVDDTDVPLGLVAQAAADTMSMRSVNFADAEEVSMVAR